MRPDGRKNDEVRPLSMKLGELSRADGSGRFAFGPVAALASFTGPTEIRLREEKLSESTLEITHRPLSGVGGVSSRAAEASLTASFSPLLNLREFPRSLCQVVVQDLSPAPAQYPSSSPFGAASTRNGWPAPEVEDEDEYMEALEEREEGKGAPMAGGGFSARAAAINATSLAVLHAGSVGMRAMPIAIAVALTAGGELVVDPTLEEESSARARFGFGWAFGAGITSVQKGDMGEEEEEEEGELVWIEAEGEFTRQEMESASEMGREAAERVLDYVKALLGGYFEPTQ